MRPYPWVKVWGVSDHLGLGDAEFDRAFIVTGDGNAAIRWTFSALARQRLVAVLPSASMRSDDDHVTLTVFVEADTERTVNALLDVVGDVASAGANGLDVFASLPGAKVVRATGAGNDATTPELRIITTRGECIAHMRWVDGGMAPRLSHSTRDIVPPFKIRIVAGLVPNLPTGMLSEYATRLLPELDGVTLSCEKGVLSLWWTTTPTPATLMTGANLLVEIADASGGVGPFR